MQTRGDISICERVGFSHRPQTDSLLFADSNIDSCLYNLYYNIKFI